MKTECEIFKATGTKATDLECQVCKYRDDCPEIILDDAQKESISVYAKAIAKIRKVIKNHEG